MSDKPQGDECPFAKLARDVLARWREQFDPEGKMTDAELADAALAWRERQAADGGLH